MTYVVLVTGSREWTDYHRLAGVLTQLHHDHPDMVVRHGKAKRGADRMAATWCTTNGVPQDPMEADWDLHGLSAGFQRNTSMVYKTPQPRECHAFMTTHCPGTKDCAKKAKVAGIHVKRHR